METFIAFVQNSFYSLRDNINRGNLFYPPNLTTIERHALRGLQEDNKIIIKPADKGGALVVMNRSDYLQEVSRQLSDITIYQKLQKDPTSSIRQKISDTLHKYTQLGVLDTKTVDFLTNPHPVIPVFYTIPKIHKNLEKPPGRPIVASTDSILSPLARYNEKILTPLIQTSKSYIVDTGAFLEVLQSLDNIPPSALLVTMDVKDLYTSIPHIEGINSVHKLLTLSSLQEDHVNLCVELLTIILTYNHFMFQDDFYLQLQIFSEGFNSTDYTVVEQGEWSLLSGDVGPSVSLSLTLYKELLLLFLLLPLESVLGRNKQMLLELSPAFLFLSMPRVRSLSGDRRNLKGPYQLFAHDSGPKHDSSTSLLTSQPCWDMVAIHQPYTTPSIWTIQGCSTLISKQDCLKISLHIIINYKWHISVIKSSLIEYFVNKIVKLFLKAKYLELSHLCRRRNRKKA
ncbi:unnamed protein product [Ranitomeya imitator]|uniref:Reverse transcriptase domain-containing protein n=1 Tax=Ranitomeya imitator TaxID=111125 RepID=A0ABN9LEN1_9NEOB|nr:unnamed protein product [Ranitomeya imitator]